MDIYAYVCKHSSYAITVFCGKFSCANANSYHAPRVHRNMPKDRPYSKSHWGNQWSTFFGFLFTLEDLRYRKPASQSRQGLIFPRYHIDFPSVQCTKFVWIHEYFMDSSEDATRIPSDQRTSTRILLTVHEHRVYWESQNSRVLSNAPSFQFSNSHALENYARCHRQVETLVLLQRKSEALDVVELLRDLRESEGTEHLWRERSGRRCVLGCAGCLLRLRRRLLGYAKYSKSKRSFGRFVGRRKMLSMQTIAVSFRSSESLLRELDMHRCQQYFKWTDRNKHNCSWLCQNLIWQESLLSQAVWGWGGRKCGGLRKIHYFLKIFNICMCDRHVQ